MAKDKSKLAEITIDYAHYQVHDENMYHTGYYFTVTAASTQEFMVVSGATDPHVTMNIAASGQSIVKFYEGITTSANGTSVSVYNMHRDSTDSCLSTFFHTPTWSTNSEIALWTDLIPGGDKNVTQVGGSASRNTEWILNPSTKYLIQVTNQAASTIGATINIEFYEMDV